MIFSAWKSETIYLSQPVFIINLIRMIICIYLFMISGWPWHDNIFISAFLKNIAWFKAKSYYLYLDHFTVNCKECTEGAGSFGASQSVFVKCPLSVTSGGYTLPDTWSTFVCLPLIGQALNLQVSDWSVQPPSAWSHVTLCIYVVRADHPGQLPIVSETGSLSSHGNI